MSGDAPELGVSIVLVDRRHLSVDGTTVSPDDLLNSLATDHRAAKCYELF